MPRYLLALMGGLAVAGCNTDPNPAATPEGGNEPTDAGQEVPMQTDQSVIGLTPQQFVETIAASDLYEIEAAKLAQKNASTKPTRDFAAIMIKDHTASTGKLKDAAQKSRPPITVTPALTAEQQSQIDALQKAGTDFDSTYARQQTAAHQKALDLLKGYSATGSDPSLKAFATEAVKVVEGHASHARELLRDTAGQ